MRNDYKEPPPLDDAETNLRARPLCLRWKCRAVWKRLSSVPDRADTVPFAARGGSFRSIQACQSRLDEECSLSRGVGKACAVMMELPAGASPTHSPCPVRRMRS